MWHFFELSIHYVTPLIQFYIRDECISFAKMCSFHFNAFLSPIQIIWRGTKCFMLRAHYITQRKGCLLCFTMNDRKMLQPFLSYSPCSIFYGHDIFIFNSSNKTPNHKMIKYWYIFIFQWQFGDAAKWFVQKYLWFLQVACGPLTIYMIIQWNRVINAT